MTRAQGTIQLPPQLSTYAPEVDWVYYFVYWLSLAFFIAISFATVWFVIRYRRRPGVQAKPTGHSTTLEIAWTVLPLILIVFLFHWGFQSYIKAAVPPDNALTIRVRGMQWNWEFEHPNGAIELNELTVPVRTPIKLVMSSSDVLHSFFVPAFRIKKDVVPGMYTVMWFEATEAGDVQAYCAEYCGAPPGVEENAGHSSMLATVSVVTRSDYDAFLEAGPRRPEGLTPEQWGADLVTQYGCPTCHGADGIRQQPAPNFKGLFGRQETLQGGGTVVVDEEYIRESVAAPQAKIVAGYTSAVMPPFRLGDAQLEAIIAYIRSLSEN